jgi:hypothetical protein
MSQSDLTEKKGDREKFRRGNPDSNLSFSKKGS